MADFVDFQAVDYLKFDSYTLSSGIIAIKREEGHRRWEVDRLRGRERGGERENMHKFVGR